jgi:hypothetical protein
MFDDIIGSRNFIDTRDISRKIKQTSEEFILSSNDPRFEVVSAEEIEKSLDDLLSVHGEIEKIFPIKLYKSISTYYNYDKSIADHKKKVNFDKIIKFDFPYLFGGKREDFKILRLDLSMIFVYISYIVEDTIDDLWVCRISHAEERLYPHRSFVVD